jgi:hypothetical protein
MEPVLEQYYGWLEKTEILKESRAINVGDKFYGYYYDLPREGQHFNFFIMSDGKIRKIIPMPFSTSKVVKIQDECTFRTRNSVYKLISKEKMREINIETILNEKESQS